MKSILFIICGVALAAIGGLYLFEMNLHSRVKTGRELKSAPGEMRPGETGEVAALLDAGFDSLKQNDAKSAEDAFRKALEINPQYTNARAALAHLYFATKRVEKGEQELMLAVKSDPENEKLLHIIGTYDFGARQLDDYENLYGGLLKEKPDSLSIKKKLTEIFLIKGKIHEARRYIGQIWKAQPGDTDAVYLDGRLYLAETNYVQATEKLFSVTRDDPRFAPGHFFLGRARLGTHDTREAKIAFNKAKELNPVWVEPRMALARIHFGAGAYDLALEESEPILQTQPRNVEFLLMTGVARLKMGKVEQALDLLYRAKDLAPTDANPHISIGAAYVVQKSYSRALTEYEQALKLDPDRIDALSSIAQVLAAQGNQKAVIARVQQHLAKTRNHAGVYQLLGQLSVDQQDHASALGYLEKAVASDPELISASYLIASTYMAQKKFDQAIAEAEKIIRKHPKATQFYMLLGTLHDLKQRHDEANRYYRKVLELDKNSAVAANNLAWNYAQYGGNLDMALTLAQKAVQSRPNDEHIAHTLGWIYYKKGAYLMAIGLLKESSEKFKDRNPSVLYHLGMAYRKNGDNALAKESFSKALQLNQDFREAQEAKRAMDEIGAISGRMPDPAFSSLQ